MLKIRDDVDLKELEKFGFEKKISYGGTFYERWYRTVGYSIDKNGILYKLKDLGPYTEEFKITKQDISRLDIADLIEME